MNYRPFISYSIIISTALLCLNNCASGPKSNDAPEEKVGMHIDAMYEFAVEYPLSWPKTRQQNRSTGWGQVRWSAPDNSDVQLAITSQPLNARGTSLEQQLAEILSMFPGLVIETRETVELIPGPAMYVQGRTASHQLVFYLINSATRCYTIRFTAPEEAFDNYADLLDEVRKSFLLLGADDASS